MNQGTKGQLPHPYSAIHALNLPDEGYFLLQSIYHHLGGKCQEPVSPELKGLVEAISSGGKPKTVFEKIVGEISDHYKSVRMALDEFKDEA